MYQTIKKLCEERGINISHLERKVGLSIGSICKWEKAMPRADSLQKVADFFGVSTRYLLDSKDASNESKS